MAFENNEREDAPVRKRAPRRRRKVCVFCGKDNVIDYKDVNKLKRYVSERGKNSSQKSDRKLRETSESYYCGYQARKTHGDYAVCGRVTENRKNPGADTFCAGVFFAKRNEIGYNNKKGKRR